SGSRMEPLSPELAVGWAPVLPALSRELAVGSVTAPELVPPFGPRIEPFSDQRAERSLQSWERRPGAASGRSMAERTASPWGRAIASAGTRKPRAIRARAGTRRRERSRDILTS